MIGVIIALSIFCGVSLIILGKQDDKNTALAAENGLQKGRMEYMRDAATITNSFKENFMTYINLINDGNRRVKELYEKIEEEKTHPALTTSALIQEAQQENKILS